MTSESKKNKQKNSASVSFGRAPSGISPSPLLFSIAPIVARHVDAVVTGYDDMLGLVWIRWFGQRRPDRYYRANLDSALTGSSQILELELFTSRTNLDLREPTLMTQRSVIGCQ